MLLWRQLTARSPSITAIMYEVIQELKQQKSMSGASTSVSGSPFVIDSKIQELQQHVAEIKQQQQQQLHSVGEANKCVAEVVVQ